MLDCKLQLNGAYGNLMVRSRQHLDGDGNRGKRRLPNWMGNVADCRLLQEHVRKFALLARFNNGNFTRNVGQENPHTSLSEKVATHRSFWAKSFGCKLSLTLFRLTKIPC